jgi:hypothetical protein
MNNKDFKVDIVSADQMSDEDKTAIFDKEASVDAIPDLDVLTGNVYEILEYLNRPQVKQLMKTNETAVRMNLNNKYADTVPYGIIGLLMDEKNIDENIERLLRVFESLRRAKSGDVTLDDAQNELVEDINNRYCYSKFGSKEAFEKALSCEIMKEQQKKRSIKKGELNYNVSIKN